MTIVEHAHRTDAVRTVTGWHIELEFREIGSETRAVALLRLPDGTELRARGHADRHPDDPEQPRVGEEVAAARLLGDLSAQLRHKAEHEIEEATRIPARVHP
ncbi:DUF1876 domain-containing protein [Streptomyces sp. ST2-7A]|uniref:DUF1876 domain-containing protein n=1 Tax=Streptomyces sp. ST2-7A TaxID=2907214 RepID=UPI001F173AB1|nr:DUF1876 domain-containing protein [Streptomyces sp. ST2-7A]MCE7082303.1 DUF1876 domain-containing protein [Streptomyces sp. ST2-7A]